MLRRFATLAFLLAIPLTSGCCWCGPCGGGCGCGCGYRLFWRPCVFGGGCCDSGSCGASCGTVGCAAPGCSSCGYGAMNVMPGGPPAPVPTMAPPQQQIPQVSAPSNTGSTIPTRIIR